MVEPENQLIWQTSKRKIDYSGKTLIMAILNLTPDSFSDGGKVDSVEKAVRQVEKFIEDGADIIDVGGESTRPGSVNISPVMEIDRVVPSIREIAGQFGIPVSIDTTKGEVAEAAVREGAEIINDVSGLRFDRRIGEIAAKYNTGLILMHSRGEFDTFHTQQPVSDICREVEEGLDKIVGTAMDCGVREECICLDVGIGFGKTFEQNKELIAKLDRFSAKFDKYPMLVGTSRKSFIGRILNNAPADQRLNGTVATNIISVWNGANIVRVHDVKAVSEALKVVDEIKREL
ncbi:MAG: dihydropteroate synthase [Acidobacteria bacterium]|nr:dihydropteroate synthase [Acidobacteriota bacterium]